MLPPAGPDNPRVSLGEGMIGTVLVVGVTIIATLFGLNPAIGLLAGMVLVFAFVLWRQRRSRAQARDRVT
jgi:hypothetical protein